jgi:hypothetical protein
MKSYKKLANKMLNVIADPVLAYNALGVFTDELFAEVIAERKVEAELKAKQKAGLKFTRHTSQVTPRLEGQSKSTMERTDVVLDVDTVVNSADGKAFELDPVPLPLTPNPNPPELTDIPNKGKYDGEFDIESIVSDGTLLDNAKLPMRPDLVTMIDVVKSMPRDELNKLHAEYNKVRSTAKVANKKVTKKVAKKVSSKKPTAKKKSVKKSVAKKN